MHAFNYGGLALWDAVFGTYRNPTEWRAEAGFWDGGSRRLGALLLGRDLAAMSGPGTYIGTPRTSARVGDSVFAVPLGGARGSASMEREDPPLNPKRKLPMNTSQDAIEGDR
jgi:hypothetical protein